MSFAFEPLQIRDVVLVRRTRHPDARGFFAEAYRESLFAEGGIDVRFVQDNFAHSMRGVLRGLHYQLPPSAQGKLVSAVSGRIFDVAVDLRVGAPTYGRWVGRTLDSESGEMLWIPPGFAHGYCVVSDSADVYYKTTAEYVPELSRGVQWNDSDLAISWPVTDPVLSPQDRSLPTLAVAENTFRH